MTDRPNRKWIWILIPLLAVFLCLGTLALVGGAGWFVYRRVSQLEATQVPSLAEATPVPPGQRTPAAAATGTPVPVSTATPGAQTGGQLASGDELRLFAGEPATLDPALVGDSASAEYVDKIFSGLVGLDDQLRVVPEIAEKWEVSSDGLVYTFHLRPNVYFHNGKQATALDFKYSIERACDPRTQSNVAGAYLGDIVGALDKLSGKASQVAGVAVFDGATVQVTLTSPVAYFLAKLTYPTAFLVDQATVEAGGAQWTERPNGTGVFKLVESSDQQLVLERNDRYYGEIPGVQRVTFLHSGGAPATMYEQGELDAAPVGVTDLQRVQDPANALSHEVYESPQLITQYVGLNTRTAPFDDVHLRRAFALATNKAGITEVFLRGTGIPANGILPPGMPGFQKLDGISFDPLGAKEELARSRYGSAEKLPKIVLNASGRGTTNPFAELLALMYKETLGVTIEIEQVDDRTYYSELDQGKYQMFALGWVADYPDPQNFLDLQFHSGSALNNTGYHNPEVDRLLEQARAERSESRRLQLYQEAERVVVSEAPWIPLFYGVDYTLVKPYVKGLVVTAQGTYYLKRVKFVSN